MYRGEYTLEADLQDQTRDFVKDWCRHKRFGQIDGCNSVGGYPVHGSNSFVRSSSRSSSSAPHARRGSVPDGSESFEVSAMIALRKYIESMEDRLTEQISKALSLNEQVAQEKTMKMLQAKVMSWECLQPKLERKIAELGGSLKGLSEEVQSQLLRADTAETRLHAWRSQVEEDWTLKNSKAEEQLEELLSIGRTTTATNEDFRRECNARLSRLENRLEERSLQEDIKLVWDKVALLESRLDCSDTNDGLSRKRVDEQRESSSHSPQRWLVEQQLSDVLQTTGRLEAQGLEMQERFEEHDVRLVSLRSRVDVQEQRLVDRLQREIDLTGQLEDLRQVVAAHGREVVEMGDRVDMLTKTIDAQDLFMQETNTKLKQLATQKVNTKRFESTTEGSKVDVDDELAEVIQLTIESLDAAHHRTTALEKRIETEVTSLNLGPQLGVVMDVLKDVVPKVASYEFSLQETQDKVEQIAWKCSQPGTPCSPAHQGQLGASPYLLQTPKVGCGTQGGGDRALANVPKFVVQTPSAHHETQLSPDSSIVPPVSPLSSRNELKETQLLEELEEASETDQSTKTREQLLQELKNYTATFQSPQLAFAQLDAERRGRISFAEFKAELCLAEFGPKLSAADAKRLFEALDTKKQRSLTWRDIHSGVMQL